MKKYIPYILILVSLILLSVNIYRLNISELKTAPIASIIANILIIFGFIAIIRKRKKLKE